MDFELVVLTTFMLLVILVICGAILLFPLSRKLGLLIESRIEDKKAQGGPGAEEIRHLASRLAGIEDQLQSLAERQDFLDRLVTERRPIEGLPSGREKGSST
jgi:hypothetical protein